MARERTHKRAAPKKRVPSDLELIRQALSCFMPSTESAASRYRRLMSRVALGPPAGYQFQKSGLVIPVNPKQPVPPSKLQEGIKTAKLELQKLLTDMGSILTEEYRISEIELSASFNADGKFLGFGVGGAAEIKVTIKPARTE